MGAGDYVFAFFAGFVDSDLNPGKEVLDALRFVDDERSGVDGEKTFRVFDCELAFFGVFKVDVVVIRKEVADQRGFPALARTEHGNDRMGFNRPFEDWGYGSLDKHGAIIAFLQIRHQVPDL